LRWTPGGESQDIEDRRDEGGGGGGGFGGGRGLGLGALLVLGALSLIFRTDLISPFLGSGGGATAPRPAANPARSAAERPQVEFVSFVLDDVQKNWAVLLPQSGAQYRKAKLVLFRDSTRSGCGAAQAETGPFYCPADEKVYIDLAFYDELKSRFGAPGQFAQAYVLAHEIGHHVQNILGVERKVRQLQEANPRQVNALSVKLELQADCLAGVWGHSTEERHILESGDVENGLAAAASVGDDRIARMAGRQAAPERFTHGSSQQRVTWFRRGLEQGRLAACDTFSGQ
jgi:predicted metalloprotease